METPPPRDVPAHARVGAETAGTRLDVFLAESGLAGSRSRAAVLIEAGRVAVDGRRRPKGYRLEEGETVEIEHGDESGVTGLPLAEDIDVEVLHEDRWLLVVDKPAGMVVHPSKGHTSGTLVNALVGRGAAGGEPFRPGIVHRLDRDTSGLLLVARDDETHRRLQRMIRAREVDRRYLALVHGAVKAATGTIDAPIGRDPVRRKTMAVDGVAARPAVTHFRVLERLGDFTYLEARLETGRTHQIRVHLLAVGHPVVGDPVYARRDPLNLGRQFLHSHRLAFEHPVTGERLCVESPLPEDLEGAIARLRSA